MQNYPESEAAQPPSIVVASNNPHKIEEFRRILSPLGFNVLAPSDLGLKVEVDETGTSFAVNALLKARAFNEASGLLAVGDDSGLMVDALGGEPGVYSARYGGLGLSDQDRCRLVVERLQDVPIARRTARFVAAIALVSPSGRTLTSEGTVEGTIESDARGSNGFGYDPIFYYPPAGRTFGEMEPAEKDAVSHRATALRQLAATISNSGALGILR
jgi:XTP/dITP diphosphohydrolase